jgi:hypothetical protein
MAVGPIIGVQVMPVVKAPPSEPELAAIADLESVARIADDSYSGAGNKAAGAEESEDEELDTQAESEPSVESPEDGSSSGISFFA